MVKRVVTVSGDIVMEPRNLLVPIGTPFSDMVEAAGFRQNPYKVLSGGPMMVSTLPMPEESFTWVGKVAPPIPTIPASRMISIRFPALRPERSARGLT